MSSACVDVTVKLMVDSPECRLSVPVPALHCECLDLARRSRLLSAGLTLQLAT